MNNSENFVVQSSNTDGSITNTVIEYESRDENNGADEDEPSIFAIESITESNIEVPNSQLESIMKKGVIRNSHSQYIIHDESMSTDDIVDKSIAEREVESEVILGNPYEEEEELDDDILNSMLDSVMNHTNESNSDEEELYDSKKNTSHTSEKSNIDLDIETPSERNIKLCNLPLGRVKNIMKSDPDVQIVSADCIFLISKACEVFLQWLGKEVHSYTVLQKKKTIQKRDLDLAITEHPALEFLDGAID